MRILIQFLAIVSTVCQAGNLSCELIYAKNGDVQRASGSMNVNQGDDGKALELSIKNLVESQAFRGSNGKISAHMQRVDGEKNYSLTDGNLLHLTAENDVEGRVLTCNYVD